MARYKQHRGGLAPDKYLNNEDYDKLVAYVSEQGDIARQRGSRRAVVNQMLIEVFAWTGMRAEELCHLQIKDLPISHGKDVINVSDGKGHVSRPIEIPHNFAERVTLFVREYRKGAKPGSAVFVNERGHRKLRSTVQRRAKTDGHIIVENHAEQTSRLTYQSCYIRVRGVGKKAGLRRLTPHMFRHTYLTRLYNSGQDLLFVKDQAGHADPSTTAIYARTDQAARRRQVEALWDASDSQIVKRIPINIHITDNANAKCLQSK